MAHPSVQLVEIFADAAAFAAEAVLLAAFVLIEMRAKEPITPPRMFADRNRSGTYLILLR
ncbi:hypothetical protein [Streptomyces atratus]|uniref:hypothetical protein n=1 Tax=Streptomyces atratus TaxID=1893 RepID=UPI0033F65E89